MKQIKHNIRSFSNLPTAPLWKRFAELCRRLPMLVGVLATTAAAFAAGVPTTPPSETFAPIDLRGYGTVSGALWKLDNESVLEIDCQDPDKAKLVQAKYLSDLQVLPGVKEKASGNFTTYEVQGQGNIACYCNEKRVVIFSARSDLDLRSLIRQVNPEGVTTAQAPIPMYLDRWDKFSFRHYYYTWRLPPGVKEANYDYPAEFDYAKSEDRAGILLPESPLPTDDAENMMNYGWVDWVAAESAKRGLPVDVRLWGNSGGEPTWLLNRYRDQTQLKMPGFTGNFHEWFMSPYLGGQGVLSWNATTGEDALLALLQTAVRRFAGEPNVVSFLEPHSETKHGSHDILLEYGPVADANYRRYLQQKYGEVNQVAARWGRELNSWNDVRVPELASFAGWGPQALDVGGLWRVGYEEVMEPAKSAYEYDPRSALKSRPAPAAWFQPDFDDSSWPQVPGGGNDKELFLQKRPAVFRRDFDVAADWKNSNPRVWLYLWDLNMATDAEVRVVLNGREVGLSKIAYFTPHWCAMEVTAALNAGKNTLAIRLPQGYIAYKTYLSPVEPREYPDLGEAINAQWVDFIDFTQWSRVEAIRRGMEMIRQAAPNQGITLAHPDEYSDGIKSLAVAYGGEFHNTGYMAAFWADYNTSLMRGADLPYSLEPGGPAKNLQEWKHFWGLWQTEGVQAVDYFIHIGDILWNPEIKADYEAHRKQISLMGQTHYPKAETAILYSDRIAQLTGYPWKSDPNTNLGAGYWSWNAASVLRGEVPYDGLSQSSFANGEADPYRVVIDSNTSIMDQAMVSDIEKWVRNGGVFVTLAQTGRHTPEEPNSWPIARLTGYRVTHIDRLTPNGDVDERGTLRAAPGQPIYGADWNGVVANGLHLEKTAAETQDLLLWNDGGVAAGVRPLGKGFIVQLGAKFTGASISNRLEPGSNTPETRRLRELLMALVRWDKITPEPGRLSADNEFVMLRHAVSNNGLYDAWTLWNQSPNQTQTVSVELQNNESPSFRIDMRDGAQTPVQGTELSGIVLSPMETRVFLTPRGQLDQAPSAWFDLQRKWWRGTTAPDPKPLPALTHRLAWKLTDDWRFRTLAAGSNAAEFSAVNYDDRDWPSRTLGIWDVKDAGGSGHGMFRKTFTVPAEWNAGLVSIWMTCWSGSSFVEEGRVWLDGEQVKPLNNGAYIAIGLPSLQPGSVHTLAVEVQSPGVLAGFRGECWLSFEPTPPQKIDLAGQWTPSLDGLHYQSPINLPGNFNAQFLRRTVSIGDEYRGREVYLTLDGDPALICVLINGKLVRRHHHMIGDRGSLNLTPFVRFGADNEIEIVRWNGAGKGALREVFLGFYNPGQM